MKNYDLGEIFEMAKKEWYITYRGVTFEKVLNGYKWGEIICRNREEIDSLIDSMENTLGQSINRLKK